MVGLVIPQDERLSPSDLSPPPRPRLTGHRRIYVAFKYRRGRPSRSQGKKKITVPVTMGILLTAG